MSELFQPTDQVILFAAKDRAKTGRVAGEIAKFFAAVKVKPRSENAGFPLSTGWRWEDPVTREDVLYNSRGGTYSVFRSRAIFRTVR